MKGVREHIVRLDDLTVGYGQPGKKGRRLCTGIRAGAASGDLVCIMGKNGVGKSTLLRTLARLHPALGGCVVLKGQDSRLPGAAQFARLVAYVSTERIGHGNISVIELVRLGRHPHTGWLGNLGRADREAVDLAVGLTGLAPLANRLIHEISDGERQRAMIARALAQDTPVIFMDEPTAFLDLPGRYDMIRLLRRLCREQGKCIIFSSHDYSVAMDEADLIWLMADHSLVAGAPESLALNGQLNRLLEGSDLRLDITDGQIRSEKEKKHGVSLAGDPAGMFWTTRALEKNGFYVSSEKDTFCTMSVSRIEKDFSWTVQKSGQKLFFTEIYDLILHLRTAQNTH